MQIFFLFFVALHSSGYLNELQALSLNRLHASWHFYMLISTTVVCKCHKCLGILTTLSKHFTSFAAFLSSRLCGPSRSRQEKPQKLLPGERSAFKLNLVGAAFTLKWTTLWLKSCVVFYIVFSFQNWKKFGNSEFDAPGPNVATTTVSDDVFMTFISSKEVSVHCEQHADV